MQKKKTLVVASGNADKIREIFEIFADFAVISQKEAGFDEAVEENGGSFTENALIKARSACSALGVPVLADDSGLCVDALDGAPGIYSARYSGTHGADAANRALLLERLQGVADRSAHFCCAVALVYPDGREWTAEGRTYGKIALKEQGNGGFGYDSLFVSDDLRQSFGEASAAAKNAVSHRFRALSALREKLSESGV